MKFLNYFCLGLWTGLVIYGIARFHPKFVGFPPETEKVLFILASFMGVLFFLRDIPTKN